MPPGDASETVTKAKRTTKPVFATPSVTDGTRIWELARDSRTLDVNSHYSYLLWCRDFAHTSIVANDGDACAGFITGYLRADAPDTLFVWQVAVSADHRRQGLARRMLDELVDRAAPKGPRFVEATVTPSNAPSTRLFESFAAGRHAELTKEPLFDEELLGDGHEAEILFRIGPLTGHT